MTMSRNAWRDAWQQLDGANSSVPVTVMRGDPTDQGAMTPEEAYVGDISALSRLNARYRMPTIIVVTVEGDKASGPLTVSGMRYDTQTGQRTVIARTSLPDAALLGDTDIDGLVKDLAAELADLVDAVKPLERERIDTLLTGGKAKARGNDPLEVARQPAHDLHLRANVDARRKVDDVTVEHAEAAVADAHADAGRLPVHLDRATLERRELRGDLDVLWLVVAVKLLLSE